LNNSELYRDLFKKAFNVDVITSKEVAYALAQFERIMISSNSKYDRYLRGETMLTDQELEGMVLYNTEEADCFHCHGTALFTDNIPRNNGLDQNPDDGLFAVTGDPMDLGRFKTPTLRNIEYTAPYMHDGRFQTLEEVVDFYSSGVQNTATVDPLMVYAHNGGVQLTQE
jgi:cytochrome c peroxidase